MKTYEVTDEIVATRTFRVQAESEEEAMEVYYDDASVQTSIKHHSREAISAVEQKG